jgi:dolichol kinase
MTNPDQLRAAKKAVLRQGRSAPHALRRAYHMAMGLLCFSTYAWWIERETACWIIALLGGPLLIFDVLRLQSPTLRKFALQHFSQLMRRNELLGLSGNSFFIAGLFTTVFFFPKPIVLLSLLFLAVGDPVAAFVGTRYGKHKIGKGKSWEGALANLFVSSLVSLWFAAAFLLHPFSKAVVVGVMGGIISMLAELVPAPVDDNFSVPVVAAVKLFRRAREYILP